MRTYEIITILKPQLSDGEVAEFVDKTKKAISHDGGEVVSEEKLGRRKLSHAINHVRDGFYTYLKFKSTPHAVAKLGQQLRLNESVMRSAIMRSLDREVSARPPAAAK